MLSFIAWYITLSALGLLTFPLAYRLFPALADRGYTLSRALGLLLWAFVFWLAVSLGLAQNDSGGLLLGLIALAALNAAANWVRETPDSPRELDFLSPVEWIRAHWRTVLTVEVLFLAAFAFMAFVRASNPDATGTEKPMELAFINAILRSSTFPPHDPWLSGYAISYYYFGYVMTAMLAKFTATAGAVAFNLMSALVFALGALGAYGILYSLLSARGGQIRARLGALLAPLFLLLVSNIEGFLEVLHALGLGWNAESGPFWAWLNIKDLVAAPSQPYSWDPRFWFWWRASRVITDVDFVGNIPEVIDEFPFFSFLLGDLHPHVLAIPFGLLAAALALNLYLGGWDGETRLGPLRLPIRRAGLALLAVTLGGLAFLNTWDFPIYLGLITIAFTLRRIRAEGWDWARLEEFFTLALPLGLASVLLYMPFYLGFASQAGGILPNVIFPTRGAHLWVMFGTLWLPLFAWGFIQIRSHTFAWKWGGALALGVFLFLWIFSTILALVAAQTALAEDFVISQGFSSPWALFWAATLRRMAYFGGAATVLTLLGSGIAFLVANAARGRSALPEDSPRNADSASISPIFVFLLVIFGALLVLAPEFIYLRDQFGTRMNTVFKFYYQAWMFWSLAAAYASTELLSRRNLATQALVFVAIGVSLFYPVLALPEKTNNFNPMSGRTLDSTAYMKVYFGDDAAAIAWLQQAKPGRLAEAVGDSYTDFARIATQTGLPGVLGWPGHERQWRGGGAEMGNRMADLQRMYETADAAQAQAVLKQYGIEYVYIGPLERSTYRVSEEKFAFFMVEVYRAGQVVIFRAP